MTTALKPAILMLLLRKRLKRATLSFLALYAQDSTSFASVVYDYILASTDLQRTSRIPLCAYIDEILAKHGCTVSIYRGAKIFHGIRFDDKPHTKPPKKTSVFD